MAKKSDAGKSSGGASVPASLISNGGRPPGPAREDTRPTKLKPSSLLDTRVIYCGDNLEQLARLPKASHMIESFFKRSHKVIVALTVQEILDEHIAKKLV